MIDELQGTAILSKLDLQAKQPSSENSSKHSKNKILNTPRPLFLLMLFSLINESLTFQNIMNKIHQPFLQKFIRVFFNDIILYSKIINAHAIYILFQLIFRAKCSISNVQSASANTQTSSSSRLSTK
ncbi:hypothetical protein KFK09_008603 [Dendrobium nobile]|uniref:Uncharacterized protein n=1 Tax=Dendrobium nobile TaxID=94219 RepID=A0A8T3BPD1_DENNO|nr:hypothetical protein KFK09_008603 [Dendrobium nobile]